MVGGFVIYKHALTGCGIHKAFRSIGTGVLALRLDGRSVKTIRLHLVPNLRTSGAVPLCPHGVDRESFVLTSVSVFIRYSNVISYCILCPYRSKKGSKVIPQQAELAHGVPGRLRPRIFSTFGTTRVVGRQPNAPAAFTLG